MAKEKAGKGLGAKAKRAGGGQRSAAFPDVPGTPSEVAPAGTHGAEPTKPIKAEPVDDRGPVNVIVDSRGTHFDPEVHATHADGVTPHTDSFGHFIAKAHHYDGAKKSPYKDTHRHA